MRVFSVQPLSPFFPPSFNRLSLTDTLFTPLRPPPHDHRVPLLYFKDLISLSRISHIPFDYSRQISASALGRYTN